jgi:hypothetical protein
LANGSLGRALILVPAAGTSLPQVVKCRAKQAGLEPIFQPYLVQYGRFCNYQGGGSPLAAAARQFFAESSCKLPESKAK